MALTDFFTQIADSIRSKDGTTDAIKATDFPQRILNIPSGGGNIKFAKGSFTLSENQNSITIEHNIGITPEVIVLVTNTTSLKTDNNSITGIIYSTEFTNCFVMYGKNSSVRVILSNIVTDKTDTQFTISSSTYSLLQGVKYNWYVIGGTE